MTEPKSAALLIGDPLCLRDTVHRRSPRMRGRCVCMGGRVLGGHHMTSPILWNSLPQFIRL
ncbi:unnamed protein product, partial [Staurois parvus]